MSESISPADAQVLRRARGLVGYLQAQVKRAPRQVRDAVDRGEVYWFADVDQQISRRNPRVLLEIEYQPPPDPPQPPTLLRGWLDRDEWSGAAGPRPRLIRPEGDETAVPAPIQGVYDDWIALWEKWANEERTSRAAVRTCYERLDRMAREASQRTDTHELVLGVGLVSSLAEGSGWEIRRHVLVWEVAIERDEVSNSLRLMLPVDFGARGEADEFLVADDGFRLERSRSPWFDADLDSMHPFSPDAVQWLEQWRTQCWERRLPFDPERWSEPGPDDGEAVQLTLAPAVLLRERDVSGLERYYSAIAESLDESGASCPLGLAQLVVPLESEQRLRWLRESAGGELPALSEDPLLPLSTNQNQSRVLTKLRQDTGVVVQGPPGTGKTHTIANLICALLADGQRILITSQKDQALRVLRGQVPAEVRELCVLMTGMRSSGADELDRSITALSDLSNMASPEQLRYDISELRQRRVDLLSALRGATRELQSVREQEYADYPALPQGYGRTLADLVRAVNEGRERHEWIDLLPPAASGVPPLSNEEAGQLRHLLAAATAERIARTKQQFPPLHLVPSPPQVTAAVSSIMQAESILGSDRETAAWSLTNLSAALLTQLTQHVDAASEALAGCSLPETTAEWDSSDWRLTATEALLGRRNPAYWKALFDQTTEAELHTRALASRNSHEVEFGTGMSLTRLLGQARRLRTHLSRGGRLRRFRPPKAQVDATDLLESSIVNGVPPTTVADLTTLIIFMEAEIAVTGALDAWASAGVPIVHGPLRLRIAQLQDVSHNAVAVKKLIAVRDAAEQALRRSGIRYTIRTPMDWDRVVRVVRAGPAITRAQHAAESLTRVTGELDAWGLREQAAPEVAELATALRDRDVDSYTSARARLEQARKDKETQERCDALAARLEQAHPALIEQLIRTPDDPDWTERLDGFEQAWTWGWAVAYHRAMQGSDRDYHLERRIDEIEQRLQTVTAELAGKQATLHWLTRLTEQQRQALQSYRNAMGKHGKGRGRHKDRHFAAARDAMREAQHAVPAWVMPLSIIADTIPPRPNTFDVVIVDEASQAGISSLFLLWLAPRIVVVGDEKQCAPGASPASSQETAENSIDHYLGDLPRYQRHNFSPDSNLYELMLTYFPNRIRLSEHFRCMPEIIGWSSAQFYENRLVPVRQFGADRLDPLKIFWVTDAKEEGRDATLRNQAEAEAMIDQVQKMIDDPVYRGRSIGIIALQNCKQAQLLDKLLNQRIDPADIRRFDIRVGYPPDFQGDQRDVILLSMVVTKAKKALTGRQEQRRYNVAASRARDQLWLFVSVTPDALASGGLRQSLLAYMMNPPAAFTTDPNLDDATEDDLQMPFESLLEQRVFLALRRRGYAVVPKYAIEDRLIDLIVVGNNGRLAVQCDTPARPVTAAQLESELRLEQRLRRSDWQFIHVRESEYLLDPAAALEPLWRRLAERGIEPRPLPAAPRGPVRWSPVALSDEEGEY